LRRSLRREPYEIFTAESVPEALQILDEEQDVALVLSDHKMPGVTGLQFLEQVAVRHPSAVRMLITGWTETIPPESIAALGVCEVLAKPWEDARLKEALRRALKASVPAEG
jgi:CheY-like chemotaxis protein